MSSVLNIVRGVRVIAASGNEQSLSDTNMTDEKDADEEGADNRNKKIPTTSPFLDLPLRNRDQAKDDIERARALRRNQTDE